MTGTSVLRALKLAAVLLALAGFFSTQAATPAHLWSQRAGGTDGDAGNAVATDAAGNVFVAGYFRSTINLGGGDLTSAGSTDIYLVKYNAAGAHQWSQRFGGTDNDYASGLAVDGSGNVLLTGNITGAVDFGGGFLPAIGAADAYLAKYDSNGAHLWSRRFGGVQHDAGSGVAVDGSDNVFLTGHFQVTANFGGGLLISAGGSDIFLAKYAANGTHLWSQQFGGSLGDVVNRIAIDPSANVFLTGNFQGTVNFGGSNLVSAGNADIFLAKYTESGLHQWSQRFGDVNLDEGTGVSADASGNVVLTGGFNGTADFGGGDLVTTGNNDIVLAKYDANGGHLWSHHFGGTSSDYALQVDHDNAGDIFFTGYFIDSVDFGGGSLTGGGSLDIFLVKYSAGGLHLWSKGFGNTASDIGTGVSADPSGDVFLNGYFNLTVDFGGGNLTSAGSSDMCIVKYAGDPAEPMISSIVDVGNDQGRKVRIEFVHSGFDDVTSLDPIMAYEAYRRDDPVAAARQLSAALTRQGLLDLGWVFVGQIPAHAASGYLIDAPTDADSTITSGMHHSVFFIRAATAAPGTFYDSAPDSGYSLDNLAPSVPQNFAYNTGMLTWDESSDTDFDYFSVYGASTSDFGTSTLINHTVSSTQDVTATPYAYYFATATDFSGNEGTPATIDLATGIVDTPVPYALSVSSYPNPFNPTTTIRYTLPQAGPATVAIYDAAGALVDKLVSGIKPKGTYIAHWNARDTHGNTVTSGVYFVRVSQGGRTSSHKVVLLQ